MASPRAYHRPFQGGLPSASAAATPLRVATHLLDRLFAVVEHLWALFLRLSLAVILLWIGVLKFINPTPIAGLLHASPLWGFLAFNGFVYALGVLELVGALFLLLNRGVRYVGLLVGLLFVGTLSILVTAPAVTFGTPQGFPILSLAGQFLLKDLGLAAAALAMVAHDVRRRHDVGKPTACAR